MVKQLKMKNKALFPGSQRFRFWLSSFVMQAKAGQSGEARKKMKEALDHYLTAGMDSKFSSLKKREMNKKIGELEQAEVEEEERRWEWELMTEEPSTMISRG